MSRRTEPVPALRDAALAALVGLGCGVASALFLALLDLATVTRLRHGALVYALPAAGLVIGWVYQRWGRPIAGGNSLVIDTIHTPTSAAIPIRMAPMVLVGTVLTHLFGGSAGREGTAVQMGGSLADALAHRLRANPRTRATLIAAGIAGGFGSVFGTPWAGALFGIEVLVVGRLAYRHVVPALVASFIGDFVTRRLGIVHTPYPRLDQLPALSLGLGAKLVLAGVAMGIVAAAFIELQHGLKRLLQRAFPALPVRMLIGGGLVLGGTALLGTRAYLGLGVPTILQAFADPTLPPFAFAAKLVLTAVTLASGFLGGEVTPLFFVGATLGNALARVLDVPLALGAACGLGAVFGAAANAPWALTVMVGELVGWRAAPAVALASAVAYLVSGHRSIYPAQRLARRKGLRGWRHRAAEPWPTLAEHRARRPSGKPPSGPPSA